MKDKSKIRKKMIVTVCTICLLCLTSGMTVFASEPKIISGTKNLLSTLTTALTGLIAGATIVMGLVFGFKWQAADEDEKPRHAKSVKTTVIIGVVLTCMSGLITWILSYYA